MYTQKRGLKKTIIYSKGKKGKKGATKRKKNREVMRRKERKEQNETKIIMHALRAQAESRGDMVAVCWYDLSYYMST